MKGITPISKIPKINKITIDFILERAKQRTVASSCSRCGGTGSFSTVGFEGIGSRYGAHCFACGDAWKLPIKWKSMTPKDISDLFDNSWDPASRSAAIAKLVDVKILEKDKAEKVLAHLA